MTVYALIHGAWHGGWCWNAVVAELRGLGHEAVAVDLPCDDPEAGTGEYADVVVDALRGVRDEVIVVGHSLGGLVAPVVAQRREVRRVVFLAAMLPLVGESWEGYLGTQPRGSVVLPGLSHCQIDHGDGSTSFRPEHVAERLCPDATAEVAAAVAARLRRQYWTPTRERSALTAWPEVEYAAIACAKDWVLSPIWLRRTFRDWFHVAALELPGDHSPHLSRPAALAALLAKD